MSVNIYFANNSIRNTKISCDSLGVHYTIGKPGSIISVSRWDSKTNTDFTIGQFELPWFRSDKIRLGEDGEWQPMKEYLRRGSCFSFSHPMYFQGKDGTKYVWREGWAKLFMTSETSPKDALITYHRNHSAKNPSFLEVTDTSVLSNLDDIILTFLVAERKRRNRQDRRRRARASGGGP